MTTADIYNWLFTNLPDDSNSQLKLVWINMASYCYFINTMDFDSMYRDNLKRVLDISAQLGIQIPDTNHSRVLEIANELKQTGTVSDIQHTLNGH